MDKDFTNERNAGKTHWMQMLIILALIASGIVTAVVLIKFKKQPKRVAPPTLAPLVKTETIIRRDIPMVISGFGTVQAKLNVEITPQVAGNVVWKHPQLTAGGFIEADTEFLRIDQRDYKLAVQQAQAAVAEAVVKLDLEKAEGEVARTEWRQLNPDTEPTSSLVFRQPQIQQAEAKLASAKAGLEVAKLNLERTSVNLPVDVRVVSESVDLGQFVNAAKPIATAYGTERVEIELPLEDYELQWFDIVDDPFASNRNKKNEETTAEVIANLRGSTHKWQGEVVRTTGRVDPTSRLIYVVIEVANPFESMDDKPPLLPGTFVEICILGRTLTNAIAVNRDALHNKNEVWVVKDNKIHVQVLDIQRFDSEYAYVTEGLKDNDLIVTSSLDTVTENMIVRLEGEEDNSSPLTAKDNNTPETTEKN
jgi:RND family efflux transporter MFP subunit